MAKLTAAEREKTKLRERTRRAITTRIFQGLRRHGNYNLAPRADINEVLRALAEEAGWIVEADGTTYRNAGRILHNMNGYRGVVEGQIVPYTGGQGLDTILKGSGGVEEALCYPYPSLLTNQCGATLSSNAYFLLGNCSTGYDNLRAYQDCWDIKQQADRSCSGLDTAETAEGFRRSDAVAMEDPAAVLSLKMREAVLHELYEECYRTAHPQPQPQAHPVTVALPPPPRPPQTYMRACTGNGMAI